MRTIEEIKADIEYLKQSDLDNTVIMDCMEELLNYREAERDGRCMVLPCKVGDTVYRVKRDGTIDTPYVTQFHISQKPWQTIVSFEGDMCGITDFGKTVFLTKTEAEQTLKGGAE